MTAATTPAQCPDALRKLQAWVCWRYEQHDGEAKPRKVPHWATNGRRRAGNQGGDNDRRNLVDYEQACAAVGLRGMDGVGLCLLPGLGITAVDFDNCVSAGVVHPEVERVVAGTYAELSPSGTGVRAFFCDDGSGDGLGNRKAHGEPFGFEVFSTTGFCTFTGCALPIAETTDSLNTVAPVTPELLALCEARFGRAEAAAAGDSATSPVGLTVDELRAALAVLDPSMGHDPWLRVGMALHHETSGEGFDLWDEWSSHGVQYPGRDALLSRWDSFGRGTQRPTTAHYLAQLAGEQGHVVDLLAGVADDFQVIETTPAPAADKSLKFAPVQMAEFMEGKPAGWIVKGVVPRAELMVVFGEPGSGKSFVALDLAAAIARGIAWRGHRVKQGEVVYVAAEGAGGFRNRLKAYCAHHEVEPKAIPLHVVDGAPNLLTKDDALAISRAVLGVGRVAVVVVDTLAQTTPGGNENAAEDMGKALAHCKGIHRATGALVMLIHHTGKDLSKGARGWSGLRGAADAQLEVSRLAAGRAIRCDKQKDGEDGQVWGFDLDVVPVGADEDGDIVTSCVVRECEAPVRQTVAKLGKWQRAVLAAVTELGGTGSGAPEDKVLAAAIGAQGAPGGGKRDRRAEYVRDALAELVNRNVLEIADDLIHIL